MGEGRTSVVFIPSLNKCSRSIVLGDSDAGTAAGGSCDTIVVSYDCESSVVPMVVGDSIFAETEWKVLFVDELMTLILNLPEPSDLTLTVTVSEDVSSFCRVITRSYTSPPKRRDGRDVQGEDPEGFDAG